MNKKLIRSCLGLGLCVTAVIAIPKGVWSFEGGARKGGPEFIQHFDQNDDGMVSIDEFFEDEDLFDDLDTNGDGFIDASEAPGPPLHRAAGGHDIMTNFDADGDGQLSADEFLGPAEHFENLDIDNDGFLSSQELAAGRPGSPMENGFEKDDADGGGRVSQEEFSGPEDLFGRMDADGDGYITREEARPLPVLGGPEGDN